MNARIRFDSRFRLAALVLTVLAAMPASGHVWIEKEEATGSHLDTNANEGKALAMFGDLLVVGAPLLNKPPLDLSGAVVDAGGVQVYRRHAGGWSLDQTLFSPAPATGAGFGTSVSVWDNVLVVGEPLFTPSSGSGVAENGRALVFVRSPTTGKYVYRKEIFRTGHQNCQDCRRPEFGYSVDVVGDGQRFAIAVGAPGEDDVDVSGSVSPDMGLVTVTRITVNADGTIVQENAASNTWIIRNVDTDGNGVDVLTQNKPMFGETVALARTACSEPCTNRYYLAVGAPQAWIGFDSGEIRQGGGAAWLYQINSSSSNTSSGDVHAEQMKIPSSDPLYLPFFLPHVSEGHYFEFFGSAVDVRIVGADAELMVGSLLAAVPPSDSLTGAAYFFRRADSSCCFQHEQTLQAPNPSNVDAFGASAMFAGDRVLIGAPGREHVVNSQTVHSGSVFDFEQTGTGATTWALAHELYDDELLHSLGAAVAGSEDWIATGVFYGGGPIHGSTETWQRGWRLDIAAPDNGSIQVLPPIFPIPGLSCAPDCELVFENGRHLNPNAIADDGYAFLSWIGAACESTTTSHCPIVMDANKTLSALFIPATLDNRTLILEIVAGSGTVAADANVGPHLLCPESCDGIYPAGTVVTLTASPAAGYEFVGWECSSGGACCPQDTPSCDVTMTIARHISADFRVAAGNFGLDVDFTDAGSGVVTLAYEGGSMQCSSDDAVCALALPSDTEVSISACPSGGSVFAGWSGACQGTGVCGLVLDGNKSVGVAFDTTEVLFRNGFEESAVCEDVILEHSK